MALSGNQKTMLKAWGYSGPSRIRIKDIQNEIIDFVLYIYKKTDNVFCVCKDKANDFYIQRMANVLRYITRMDVFQNTANRVAKTFHYINEVRGLGFFIGKTQSVFHYVEKSVTPMFYINRAWRVVKNITKSKDSNRIL
jgi:hypothetical protein